jgi:large subunit ribosomal protein L35Ae
METYSGIFMNYGLGNKMQYSHKGIIKVLNLDIKEKGKVVGWWIGWPEKNPKLFGRIIGYHGKHEYLMAKFKKGLPGQAVGTRITIVKNKSDI